MTDLQMSLIAAGGVFIAGVFTYNKWQEHKAKKSVERAFSTDHDDVLTRSGDAAPAVRHEPSFSLDDEAGHMQTGAVVGGVGAAHGGGAVGGADQGAAATRSEERRVGK